MDASLTEPDLTISLCLDPFAPRAARHHVGLVDRPSPDLRDAVMLLTSELVTHAVQQSDSASDERAVELKVWMPDDVVRVELHGSPDLLLSAGGPSRSGANYELMLLESVADRWALDEGEQDACMWFEIDRHRVGEEWSTVV
jgi:hypothetical protein